MGDFIQTGSSRNRSVSREHSFSRWREQRMSQSTHEDSYASEQSLNQSQHLYVSESSHAEVGSPGRTLTWSSTREARRTTNVTHGLGRSFSSSMQVHESHQMHAGGAQNPEALMHMRGYGSDRIHHRSGSDLHSKDQLFLTDGRDSHAQQFNTPALREPDAPVVAEPLPLASSQSFGKSPENPGYIVTSPRGDQDYSVTSPRSQQGNVVSSPDNLGYTVTSPTALAESTLGSVLTDPPAFQDSFIGGTVRTPRRFKGRSGLGSGSGSGVQQASAQLDFSSTQNADQVGKMENKPSWKKEGRQYGPESSGLAPDPQSFQRHQLTSSPSVQLPPVMEDLGPKSGAKTKTQGLSMQSERASVESRGSALPSRSAVSQQGNDNFQVPQPWGGTANTSNASHVPRVQQNWIGQAIDAPDIRDAAPPRKVQRRYRHKLSGPSKFMSKVGRLCAKSIWLWLSVVAIVSGVEGYKEESNDGEVQPRQQDELWSDDET